ncbi:hypothetical protein NUW58_g3701 [Xylaria curta]|uniref:Uncharacterized protein n=1 Tax=Xylaria curta TaxID=42375 RepID=A0ACC1P9U0_9PEZI|nr:hypothetical protein NUW58_g3701 [Xylaria curta]
MEDARPRKRRRLDHPEATKTKLSGSDPFERRENDHDSGAPNAHPDEVVSHLGETALIETDDSAGVTLVCYGMLENLPIISIATASIIDSPAPVPAHFNEKGIVQRSSDGACVGRLEDRASRCLFRLHNEDHIEIQFMIKTVARQGYRNRTARPVALALAIIYGPEDLSDDAGDFLDRCNYILQDPFDCKRNVPYKNPHCLSTLFEAPRMTFELHGPDSGHSKFTLSNSLKALETTGYLPEWPQPAALKTELHRHQKQALGFLIMRERPENIEHIWQARTLKDGSSTYVNDITGSYQSTPPPVWNGGILADEMGLGKTLQMISLIVADRELQRQPQGLQYGSAANSHMATLVVVPLSLISVWEDQLSCHLHPSALSWGRHHRRSRLKFETCPDVVLTTYHTVQGEYKYNRGRDGFLFGLQWRRIILDEAHIIRNKTVTSSAISALRAVSRWAITGTPIQNSFADLAGLLSFLRFPPYDSARSFDKDIVEFFRSGDIEEGARRLKALCRPIMIRRPTSVVVLPNRQDLIQTVEFSAEERQEYLRIETSLQELPNDVASHSQAHLSILAIQLINKLRLFCSVGMCSITTIPVVGGQTAAIKSESEGSVEVVVASEVALGGTNCKECCQIIDIPDILSTTDALPLDLTAASRVHLLEPQWNPAIEEQALSRVHRMGQHRPVVTMRYVMKDSIEESVALVKEKKRLLGEILPQTAQTERLDGERSDLHTEPDRS